MDLKYLSQDRCKIKLYDTPFYVRSLSELAYINLEMAKPLRLKHFSRPNINGLVYISYKCFNTKIDMHRKSFVFKIFTLYDISKITGMEELKFISKSFISKSISNNYK